MPQLILKAYSGRYIKQEQYILVRRMDDGQLVVNVIEILTEPELDEARGVKVFQAKGLFVGDRPLSQDEGAPIELSFHDIGTPWKGTFEQFNCRTFPYGKFEHQTLVTDVQARPKFWRSMLDSPTCIIRYPAKVVQSETPPAFSIDHMSASTALPNFNMRRA